jgi:putative ABC transport system permease protein
VLPVAYHLNHLWVRRTTTLATVAGVALAALALASSRMAIAGLQAAMGNAGRADVAVVMVTGSDAELTSQLDAPTATRAASLAAGAVGVSEASVEVVVTMTVERPGGGVSNLVLRGVDEGAVALRRDLRVIAGRPASLAADEMMVGRGVAGRFVGLDLGQEMQLAGRPVKVVGVFTVGGGAAESEVWMGRPLVATVSGRTGIATSIRVPLARPGDLIKVQAALAGYPELALEAVSERTLFDRQGRRVAELVQGLGVLIGGLLALAATLGAAVTLHAQVAHRRREIAVLRALGWTRPAVLGSFLVEGLLLAVAGGVVAAAGAALLDGASTSLVNVTSFTEVRVTLHADAAAVVTALALAVGVGLAGAMVPALRAAAVPPGPGMRR